MATGYRSTANVSRAGENLRGLAHGIDPPLLADQGLSAVSVSAYGAPAWVTGETR